MSVGGAGTALFEALTVRLNNNLEAPSKLDGRTTPAEIKRNNFRTVEISGRLTFASDSEYDRFTQGSESQLRATFTGDRQVGVAAGNNMLRIDAPAFRYRTFPLNLGGPGRIVVDFTGDAVFHQGSNLALEVVLANTRISDYRVNTRG